MHMPTHWDSNALNLTPTTTQTLTPTPIQTLTATHAHAPIPTHTNMHTQTLTHAHTRQHAHAHAHAHTRQHAIAIKANPNFFDGNLVNFFEKQSQNLEQYFRSKRNFWFVFFQVAAKTKKLQKLSPSAAVAIIFEGRQLDSWSTDSVTKWFGQNFANVFTKFCQVTK